MAVPLFYSVIGGLTALKLLLISSYKSTDFEVHRNWLAITYSLPFDKWYFEKTSEWTLDYPPFFAWFEYALSHVAYYFDPGMLRIQNLNYDTALTVLFQRLSVIVSDCWFAFAIYQCCSCLEFPSRMTRKDSWTHSGFVLTILLFGNAGLLMVDHIHFQYNGFLFGFLLMSIARMMQHKYEESAFWFAVLLNFKHIFIYLAPAYAVFLLRSHCFVQTRPGERFHWQSFSPKNFFRLLAIGVVVFSVSFGPFIWKGQLNQVLSRLFPFKRGLTHAYWAPNIWAVYNSLDKALSVLAVQLGFQTSQAAKASMTGGLVKEYKHTILPNIAPIFTLICALVSCIPALVKLWQHPKQPKEFIKCLVLCAYTSFLFGWHVHEKAVLLIIIPLTLLAVNDLQEANAYLLIALTGHFSLFPLFYSTLETPTKILLMLMHSLYAYFSLNLILREIKYLSQPLLSSLEKAYILGFVFVQLYDSLFHRMLGLDKYFPFLPLLLFSMYCAVGVIYSWIKYYLHVLQSHRRIWEKYD